MRPGRERKAAVIYDIRLEIVIIPLVSRIFSHGSVHSFRMNGRRRRDLLLHEIASSRRGNDVAFCGKLTVGGLDRDLADAQVRRELTLARQARAAGERSRHDVRPYRAVKLLVKRHAALRVQMICQHAFPPFSSPENTKPPFLRHYCSHDTREKGHCQISANDLRMNSVSVSVTALSTVVSTMIEDESTWSPPIFFAMT